MVERSLGVRETPGSIPGSPNPPPRSVVLLYANHPSGHSGVAASLGDQLRRLHPSIATPRIDLSTDLHPIFGPMVREAYLELIQKTPKLWDYLYDNRTVADALKEFREILSVFHRGKLRRALAAERPDAIVCTHALPCATLAVEKEQGKLHVPLVGVLTDFGVHAYWISKHVDLYLVAVEEVRRELIRRGVAPSKIRVTGIPIHPAFQTRRSKPETRRMLGLRPDRPTVLVSGGSKGMGPIQDIVGALLKGLPRIQILAVCGENKELYRSLNSRFKTRAERARLKALGFTNDPASCLAASDILIGKAGGVTASEALASEVPMVILWPLPGQEERNAKFLVSRGAALRAEDQSELVAVVAGVLGSSEKLGRLRRAAKRLGRPDSAAAACREILELAR